MKNQKMVFERKWNEFRDTGLLLLINQILHVFGWAIVCEYPDRANPDNVDPTRVYVARVKFRGFDNKSVSRSYRKISQYLVKNAKQLLKEAEE